MAYLQPTEETVAGVEALALSPDQQATLIDFIEDVLGDGGGVLTEVVPEAGAGMPVEIGEDIEQVIVTAGGTYLLPGSDVLVIVQTEEPVELLGEPDGASRFHAVGGEGNDSFIFGDDPRGPSGIGAQAAAGDGGVVVFAQGGNDTVVGTAADDILDGGEGNDLVFAGAGDDTISSGRGSDEIDGGDGFDVLSYGAIRRDEAEVTVDGRTVEIDRVGGPGSDTVTNVEYVSFTDGKPLVFVDETRDGDIARLYEVLVDRAADAEGLKFWFGAAEDGVPVVQLADYMIQSDEFQAGIEDPSDAVEFVTVLYEQGLDRAPDAAGLAFWSDLVADGTITGGVAAEFFAASDEAVELHDYITLLPPDDLV
jgi:Ca2+-binding RTX toxin-like protein